MKFQYICTIYSVPCLWLLWNGRPAISVPTKSIEYITTELHIASLVQSQMFYQNGIMILTHLHLWFPFLLLHLLCFSFMFHTPTPSPPPSSSLPSSQLIPKEVREKWQKQVDGLDAKLGGTPERPIELMIISLDTPDYLTSVCSAGVYVHVWLCESGR